MKTDYDFAVGHLLYIRSKIHCAKKTHCTIYQVTTMLATAKNVLFLGHNHLLTTSTDDLTLGLLPWAPARVIIKVNDHQFR